MKLSRNHMGKYLSTLAVIVVVFAIVPVDVLAKVGVGMGSGEIRLTDPIKPGGIYNLPPLRIFNTGDVVTTYGMDVAYHQDHPELRPPQSWFSFSPATFTLDPSKSQDVQVVMMVPVKATPGDYFAFVESGPVASNTPGTSVGVAVAAKLFFTVAPANIVQAVMYRVSSFFLNHSPWSWIVLGLGVLAIIILLVRRFFSFNISIRRN